MHNDTDTPAHVLGSFEVPIVQTVCGIPELNGLPGLRILETREAYFVSFFETAKEVGKRAVKTFEGGIHHDSRQIRMLFLAVMFVLLIDVHILARLFVVSD